MTEPKTDTKKKTRKKKTVKKAASKRKAKSKKEPAAFRPGCGYGSIGCEGERIVDWSQAADIVRSMVNAGALKLCAQHLDKLARKEAG